MDPNTGGIVAATLTASDVDDASQVSTLLDQAGPLASFTADGAYDQDGVYGEVARRSPDTAVIVPPRSSAVPSQTAGRHGADPAGPPPATHRRARPQTLAEGVKLPLARFGRGRHQPVQACDRGRTALAHGSTTRDRDRPRCRCPEPHARPWTPGIHPPGITADEGRCFTPVFRSMQHSQCTQNMRLAHRRSPECPHPG